MFWTAHLILAAHGDHTDVPALLAGMDWLDGREDDLCGYDDLADGLARIGGPAAASAVPRLRRLWPSPHSFERAADLRAVISLDAGAAIRLVVEGLWDCESGVRLLAAEHAHWIALPANDSSICAMTPSRRQKCGPKPLPA